MRPCCHLVLLTTCLWQHHGPTQPRLQNPTPVRKKKSFFRAVVTAWRHVLSYVCAASLRGFPALQAAQSKVTGATSGCLHSPTTLLCAASYFGKRQRHPLHFLHASLPVSSSPGSSMARASSGPDATAGSAWSSEFSRLAAIYWMPNALRSHISRFHFCALLAWPPVNTACWWSPVHTNPANGSSSVLELATKLVAFLHSRPLMTCCTLHW